VAQCPRDGAVGRSVDREGVRRVVKSLQRKAQLATAGGLWVTDITDEVAVAVRESGVEDGICTVYSPHTTCSVRVNEWERGFLEDFAVMLKRLVPTENYDANDERNRAENIPLEDHGIGIGHAQSMSMLLGPAGESIPVREGELCLGAWQRVLFLELKSEHGRRWLVQVVGVPG
jgi:secondary thiamine-phosphate synthase enzyme